MNHQSLNSATNKRILWDILKDNHVFDNMKNSQYIAVKNTFDSVVSNTSKNIESNFGYYTHVEKNKLIIEQLIPAIENIRSSHNNTGQGLSNPSMKVIYDANNIGIGNSNSNSNSNSNKSSQPLFHVKKSEQSEYNMEQYNQQKRDRELSLDQNVPSDIDFSDKSMENDSPIGNDMDRLIAERLASRERELSIFPAPAPSPALPSNTSLNDNTESRVSKEEKKSVTFSTEIDKSYDKDADATADHNYSSPLPPPSVEQEHTSPLFTGRSSKLKIKRQETPSVKTFSVTESQYYGLLEKINKLEMQINILQSSIQTSSLGSNFPSS